ncbi:MAG: DUF4091 domain-containing protein [Myxococcales bacterium]|nr:DUF4091 domain-containing protein [Myxococcales bacterium]
MPSKTGMQLSYRVVFAALAMILAGGSARADIAAVWALDDGTKIKADALSHALKARNGTFDGQTIKIFGARNETVAFQVIVEGGSAATSDVNVTLDAVGTIKNGAVSNDPDTYFVGRNIELFQQVYLNVRKRSKGLVWEPWEPAAPEMPAGLLGPVPDPLVPLNIIGNKLTVPANRNQGVWVDIYIPKDTQPGVHKGTVKVLVNGQPCSLPTCQLPLELTVVDATLPDKPALKTMLYFSGHDGDTVLERYFPDRWNNDPSKLKERHYKLGRRHQITMFIGDDNAPNQAMADRLSGKTFSAANGYYGWGVGQGQDVYSIHTFGGTLNSSQANTWNDWFKQNAPGVDFFLYTWDEPESGDLGQVNSRAASAKPVPAFVTNDYTSELSDISIFAVYAENFSLSNFNQGKAAGKTIWIYNGTRPFTGSFATDDVAVSPRVNAWIQYKHGIERWFYWESTYYNDFQGGAGKTNLFKEAMTFSNGSDEVNGDGVLIYPGRDLVFPAEDRGFDGPLPSIRLKNWRRGIQDAALLALAKAKDQALHDQAIAALVPAALDQKEHNQKVSWSEDGEQWLEQRRKLAMLFASNNSTPIDPGTPPTTPPGSEPNGNPPTTPGTPGGNGGNVEPDTLIGGCAVVSGDAPLATWWVLGLALLGVLVARRRRRRRY